MTTYQTFPGAERGSPEFTPSGGGSLQRNGPSWSRIKGLPEIWVGLERGWEIHCGNHSSGAAHEGGQERRSERLLLTLPHLFFLYYYKTLHRQLLISTLEWNTTKIKSISHPKGINNIKDKLFSLKQIHSYEIIFYYYKKINKSSKEFLIFMTPPCSWSVSVAALSLL